MSNENVAANLFNFANTDGVPAEVVEAVNKERASGISKELYDAVVFVAANSPEKLAIKQVVFVLHKLVAAGKLEKVPAETTVRDYLNRAVASGDIGKPSRQTYWTAESHVEDTAEEPKGEPDVESYEPDVESYEADPLADL